MRDIRATINPALDGQSDRTGGGRIANAVTQRLDSTSVTQNWNQPCRIPPLLCFFFLIVVAILSSVKKPPRSRWNQSTFLSFRSLLGKSLCKDKDQEREEVSGNRQLGKMTQRFFTRMSFFFFFFFISLFPPLYFPYLTFSFLPHPCPRQNQERKSLFPPSVLSHPTH